MAAADHAVDEPGGRYIDFLVPGLVGMGLMGGGLWGVGYAIVDMRIRKLLKRYLATPMRRSHFLGAVIVSRLLFVLPEVALLLIFARLVFGVASAGSYLAVALLIVLGALTFSGIGLLVASRARTIEAVSGLAQRGHAADVHRLEESSVSVERFPDAVQPALSLLAADAADPLPSALSCWKAPASSRWERIVAILAAWGGATFLLALRWFPLDVKATSDSMRYLDLTLPTPAENLALDEALLARGRVVRRCARKRCDCGSRNRRSSSWGGRPASPSRCTSTSVAIMAYRSCAAPAAGRPC